jgi:SnoaL-like domain
MSDVTGTVDTYLSAWNERDPMRRARLVAEAWVPDGRLTDPPRAAEGHAGIMEMAAAMHSHYPGHSFRRTTAVDAHHEYLRFGWELVGPDGAVTVAGIDVGELAPDGRLRRIAGFFGELEAAPIGS